MIIKKIMISRIILIVFGITTLRCNSTLNSDRNRLRAINLWSDWEFVDSASGRPFNFQVGVDIIYQDSFIMYRDPTYFLDFKSGITYQRNDTVYNTGEPFEDSTKVSYTFFVYKAGDPEGYRYDSLTSPQGRLFTVDSLLKAKAFKSGIFYQDNDSLVQTTHHAEEYSMLKTFMPKIKYDESYGDSSYLYFSNKLNDIRYSFSPLLDSTEKMKLCKVIFVYNPMPKDGQYKIDIPRRQMLFEIKEIEIADPNGIIALFERFKKSTSGK